MDGAPPYQNKSSINRLLYALLIGVLVTLLGPYVFGITDHYEFLPKLYRQLDPSYLTNDFFVNTSEFFGPRSYLTVIIAFLSKLTSVELVYFLLTILSNTLLAFVTFQFCLSVFPKRQSVAIVATSAVMGLESFHLADSGYLHFSSFVPSILSQALALFGLWAVFQRRLYSAVGCMLGSVIIHPLVGFVSGGISLITLVCIESAQYYPELKENIQQLKKPLLRILAAGLVLVGFVYVFYILRYSQSLNPEVFFNILIHFRLPHHYVPSYFHKQEYFEAILFLVIYLVCWGVLMYKHKHWRRTLVCMEIPIDIVLVLCLGGYIFVEIFPTRTWATLQPFRFLYLLKWIGMIVISTALVEVGSSLIKRVALLKNLNLSSFNTWALAAVFVLGMIIAIGYARTQIAYFLILLFISGVYFAFRPNGRIAAALLGVGAALLLCFHPGLLPEPLAQRIEAIKPVYRLSDQRDAVNTLSRFTQSYTPKESIFIVPPDFGRFRMTARRAIVIDFFGLPYQDQFLSKWKERLDDVYGAAKGKGFEAFHELINRYKLVPDAQLSRLGRSYGAQYAVLYKNTSTDFPALFENAEYKIVDLQDRQIFNYETFAKDAHPQTAMGVLKMSELQWENEAYLGKGIWGQKLINYLIGEGKIPDLAMQMEAADIVPVNGQNWELLRWKISEKSDVDYLTFIYTLSDEEIKYAYYSYSRDDLNKLGVHEQNLLSTRLKGLQYTNFKDAVIAQLRELGSLYHEPFSEGQGVVLKYHNLVFGIIVNNQLFFITDDESRESYIQRNMPSLRTGGPQLEKFYQVPPDVIQDKGKIIDWAKRAVQTYRPR